MQKEIIINTAQTQHFEFCKWALEKIGFSDIELSMVKRCITGRYVDGSIVKLKCIAAKALIGPGVRYYIISDSEKLVDALCTLFESKSIYEDWAERENKRKAEIKQEWQELFYSKEEDAESVKEDSAKAKMLIEDGVQEPPSTAKIQINVSLFEDFEDFLIYSLNPIGFIYKGAKLTSNTYYAQTPEGKAVVIKLLKGIRSPLTFSVECESPEDLQTVVTQLSDLCVMSDWRTDLAKKKQMIAEHRKKILGEIIEQESIQREKKKSAQYEKNQRKAAKLQVEHYENLARCPKCGSTSLSGHKKGFGVGKALTGAALGNFLFGPLGLLGVTAGNKGAKKLYVTCLNCGHRWKL